MGFRSRILLFLLLIECAIGGILYTLHNHNLHESAKKQVLSQFENSYQFIDSLMFSHSYMGKLQSLSALQTALDHMTQSSTPVAYVRIREHFYQNLPKSSDQDLSPATNQTPALSIAPEQSQSSNTLLESRAAHFNDPFSITHSFSIWQGYYSASKPLQLGQNSYLIDIAINGVEQQGAGSPSRDAHPL